MTVEAEHVIALAGLVLLALRLGWLAHRRSASRQPIYGGMLSLMFNYLSSVCFVAILPTVLMTALVLHPPPVELAGIIWSPLLLAVVGLGLGSLVFAILHALVERAPLQSAEAQQAVSEARGWTEADARTSGL
ncbi:MAG: hypothetical protein OXE95_11135 [Chloroflexi bacterium]|nr:hypothetical protein [Chloroflexota bacterium]MCY4248112.1 hypothetical protein [Chloroflexota bacterium]